MKEKGLYQLQVLDKSFKNAKEKWYTIATSESENYILEKYENLKYPETKKRILFDLWEISYP